MSDRDRQIRNVEILINKDILLMGCSNRMILFILYMVGVPIEKNKKGLYVKAIIISTIMQP